MRQVRMLGRQRVEVVEVDRPEPTDEAPIVVAVCASGLCGSEMGAYRSDEAGPGNGGHEVAGVVVEAPDRSLLGQRVGVSAVVGCGRCEYCQRGQDTYCDRWRGWANTHAEFIARPVRAIRVFPDDVRCDWATAVLLSGDGLGVPFRVSQKLGDTAGRTTLVIGLGPIGLGNVLVQVHRNARVLGLDPIATRRELAAQLGAECHDPTADGLDDWLADRCGRGPEIVIECVGSNATLTQALRWVRPGGTVMTVGENPAAEFNLADTLIRKDLIVRGSWYYQPADFAPMLDLYRAGLPVERLITHRFPLERAAEAFELFASGQTGKVVLEMGGRSVSDAHRPLPDGRGSDTSRHRNGDPNPSRDREGAVLPAPLAYLITFTTYGTWLHGDSRTSVDWRHRTPGTPFVERNVRRERAEADRLKHPPVLLDAARRTVVQQTIVEVCGHRGWTLHTLNVRSNHVHLVVSAPVVPERVMNDLKSWCTRRMVEARILQRGAKTWTRHGSTRYLWKRRELMAASEYVCDGQGEDLPRAQVGPLPDGRGSDCVDAAPERADAD